MSSELSFEDKRAFNRQSNDKMCKNRGQAIKLEGFKCLFRFTDFRNKKKFWPEVNRAKLPIFDYPNYKILEMCRDKYIQWLPAIKKMPGGRDFDTKRFLPDFFLVQDRPFIVLDVDGVRKADVEKLIREKWSYCKENHISIYETKRGIHIHLWIDMSDIPNATRTRRDDGYRDTNRYKTLKTLMIYIAGKFTQETGLDVDYGPFETDCIAISPNEITLINNEWRGKQAASLRSSSLNGALDRFIDESPRRIAKNRDELYEFFKEFDKMLDSDDGADQVIDYIKESDIIPGQRKYYDQCFSILRDKRDKVKNNLAIFLRKLFWARRLTGEISLGQEATAGMLGLESMKNITYMRHIVMYMLSLKLSTKYVIKKKTNMYLFQETEKKYFSSDFLLSTWYFEDEMAENAARSTTLLTVENMAKSLGNGNTWDNLGRFAWQLTRDLGEDKTVELLTKAIWQSSANDKSSRVVQMSRLCRSLSRSYIPDKGVA